ncbi:MAG: alpha/beta hydrolase fold domain-containing protein [Clostridiales bacterium]|nr:alpha/beta hydrolase fold domain-containing protein [Clostridiales bacterium]
MSDYTYNPALRSPGKWTGIDFADPKLRAAIRLMTNELGEKVRAMEPSSGVKRDERQFISEDGEKISCFVFEPKNGSIRGNMLYCHGGGFFLPIQSMMAELACEFAEKLSIRVYLPEYRILPDYPNPYPFLDCLSVLSEILGTDLPYLLYGESVGGTLAAGLSIWARDNGKQAAKGQCLIYPVLDNAFGKYQSMRKYSDAAWPLRNHLTMWTEYLKPGMKLDTAYLVPMKATDLRFLPAAYIEPQEIDILHDEAVAYAKRLEADGVCVKLNEISGSYHGFDEDLENPFVKAIVAERIAYMERMLNAKGNDFNDD